MPLALEITRILLRYLGVYLLTIGAPDVIVNALGDPATVNYIAGSLVIAVAEGGWVRAKFNRVVGSRE